MGSKTFVGKLSSVLALPLSLALLSLVTASPVPTSIAAATPLEPWQAPCTTGSQTTASVTAILCNLKYAVGNVKTDAEVLTVLLTEADNPRVNRWDKALWAHVHVDEFPPLPSIVRHAAKSNIRALLTRDYRTLSRLYVFLQQCQNNSRRCDTRSDASLIQTQMGSILHKLLVALCQLDKYLTAMGRPGLAVQIPGKAELLGEKEREGVEEEDGSGLRVMHDDEDCEGPLGSNRDLVDYMIARDTVRVLQRLSAGYRCNKIN